MYTILHRDPHAARFQPFRTRRMILPAYVVLVILLGISPAHAWKYVDSGDRTNGSGILATISSGTDVTIELLRQEAFQEDAVRSYIQREIASLGARRNRVLAGASVHDREGLVRFYRARDYRPAWLEPPGLTTRAYMLAGTLRTVHREGLDPADYHLGQLRALTQRMMHSWRTMRVPSPELWARMDLLLTDAFFAYASHQRTGRVGNQDVAAVDKARRPDTVTLLDQALRADSFRQALDDLPPRHAGYVLLRDALASYRLIATSGGWSRVPGGPSLSKGDQGERIVELRRRLLVSGELKVQGHGSDEMFDGELEEAVKAFQRTHGLNDDGVVGKLTLAELNVPVDERIGQIEANMERWRWLPDDLGKRYIMVNIAGFWLDVVEDGELTMSMEAIVGKDYSQTPVFSGLMTYMVLGPSWTVPRTIAVRDKLPLIRKNSKYLNKHGYKVFSGWGDNTQEVDPSTVDWSKLNEDNFPYRLRQAPGPGNALGRVKFMFPNPFDVYMHDTPEKWLFNRTRRTFSAGCIRISKPIELAEYLLEDSPAWSRKAILRNIIKWDEKVVWLPRPMPVHIQYFTAWVDEEGGLQFRDDIYGRDRELLAAMKDGAGDGADTQVTHAAGR